MFAKLQLASLLVLLVGAAAVKEPASGLDFAPKTKLGALSGLGIRKKGPIKVYAVGKYDQGFELRMVMGVGAEKMTNSLKDALKPRCGDLGALDGFSDVMLKGLPDGCPKGTCLEFGTSGGKLSLDVNGKTIGAVTSQDLAKAFADIYCDQNAVCKINPV